MSPLLLNDDLQIALSGPSNTEWPKKMAHHEVKSVAAGLLVPDHLILKLKGLHTAHIRNPETCAAVTARCDQYASMHAAKYEWDVCTEYGVRSSDAASARRIGLGAGAAELFTRVPAGDVQPRRAGLTMRTAAQLVIMRRLQ